MTLFQDEFAEAEWIDDGPSLEARFIGRNMQAVVDGIRGLAESP
jgi:hypothetical protein